MPRNPAVTVREATTEDAATIVRLVHALARFENAPPDTVKITVADVLRDGFGEPRRFETLLAELDGVAVGFALYFHNYSTWEGRAGLFVEDLFVEEHARRLGAGRKLLAAIARAARDRGCPRIDLCVLDWNPARDFCHRIGISHLEEWLPYRMTEPAISALANQ
ncbi:MAG: GNAT family N-acetyltransferase [Alphaproteobacteria bacterium]